MKLIKRLKMKRVKFEKVFKKRNLYLIDREKKIRRRPRDKEEEKIFDILLKKRIDYFYEKKLIKKIGEKKYKMKI